MDPGLTGIKDYAALVATVIGATLALFAFWQKILAGAKYVLSGIVGWITLPSRISRDVSTIKAQTLPNGGKSLADAIRRLEDGVISFRNKQLENYQITHALALHNDIGMWESDERGLCTSINSSILKRVGFTEPEALGNGWVNFIFPADRDRVYDEWTCACEQGRDFVCDYSFVSRSGERIPVKVHSYIIKDLNGKLVKFIGTVRFI